MNITDLPARIQAKLDVRDLGHATPCWIWTGASRGNGYGTVALPRNGMPQRLTGSHRYVYTLLVGPIPDGMETDHLCRNRGCANPEHLEPVTTAENLRRAFGRQSVDHCKNGHDLRETGKQASNGRGRFCAVCRNAWDRDRRRRNKAA